MAFKKYAKKVAKKTYKGVKRAVKNRYVRGNRPDYVNVVKDIIYLKSVLNPEKKRWQYNLTDTTVGQCNANGSAFLCLDVTPSMAQGITSATRNGNSIKLHSADFKFQLQQMSAMTGRINYKFILVKIKGPPYATPYNVCANMFNINNFVTNGPIIDYNSDRDEETFKQFQIIRQKNVTLPANNNGSQQMTKTFRMGVKYKSHHIKFVTDGSSTVADGQLVLIVLADVHCL